MSKVAVKPQHADAAHRDGVAERRADYESGLRVDKSRDGTVEKFDVVALGDVAHLVMGQSPDSRYVSDDMDVGVPFLQGNAEFGSSSPQPRFACTQPAKMCRQGDLLISVRAPVGEINLADRDYCIGRGLAAVRLHGVPASLAAQAVIAATPDLRRVAQGTTFDAISKSDLDSLVVRLPPMREREILARIVDTLDTAVRRTEAVIAKLKQVKQGLLHDLLTRGIDANGELRPPHSEAPHLYKQSSLGGIPKEWAARALADVAASIPNAIVDGPFGSNLKSEHYRSAGVPVIQSGYVTSGEFCAESYVYVTMQHFQTQARSRVDPGDIVMAKIGANAGMCAVVPNDHVFGILASNCMKITVEDHVVRRDWLVYYLHRLYQVTNMSEVRTETAQPAISLGRIRKMLVPVPSLDEQDRAVLLLASTEQSMRSELTAVAKLRILKSGLMDDLLTGRVRVTPLLEAATTP